MPLPTPPPTYMGQNDANDTPITLRYVSLGGGGHFQKELRFQAGFLSQNMPSGTGAPSSPPFGDPPFGGRGLKRPAVEYGQAGPRA